MGNKLEVLEGVDYYGIESFQYDRQTIYNEFNLSDGEYDLHILEVGSIFLGITYYMKDDGGAWIKEYEKHAYTREYWDWFAYEWGVWQRDYFDYLIENQGKLEKNEWSDEMEYMAFDNVTLESFKNNYLKNLKDI